LKDAAQECDATEAQTSTSAGLIINIRFLAALGMTKKRGMTNHFFTGTNNIASAAT